VASVVTPKTCREQPKAAKSSRKTAIAAMSCEAKVRGTYFAKAQKDDDNAPFSARWGDTQWDGKQEHQSSC
jgi:hypothetical protein